MVAHEGHDTATSSMNMGGMDMGTSSHGSMAMSFFTATNTALYSSAWTPTTVGQYAGTCIFLVFLSIFFRAIFTAKTFLEVWAVKSALKRRYIVVAGEKAVADKAGDEANSITGILTTNGVEEDVRVVSAPVSHIRPWRFSVDLPRALILTVAAGVGYLLMLAVMTYNVGYFLSVLAGAFVGELAFGRFNQAAAH